MTLIFSGNDYKYELENVVKLFFPAQLFNILYDEKTVAGDLCFLRLKKGRNLTYFYCSVRIGNATKRLASRIENSDENYNSQCEMKLARLLFFCLENLTGISPKWGLITGVRPVKRINQLIDGGKSEAEIYKNLSENYLVDKQKISLAISTAKTQEGILKSIPRNSFSLYVSIPFCPTRCSYCSFVSQSMERSEGIIPEYIENLCREIEYTARVTQNQGLVLDTVYFGGGTPTAISAKQLETVMQAVNSSFDLSSVREYTVEAGRADTITTEKLEVIKRNKATRISINPQSLSDKVLSTIGRNHTAQQFYDSLFLARKIGFDNINTDLIAGLPQDTIDSFKHTVDEIIRLNPENVTVHTLSIKRAAELNQNSKSVIDNPAPKMVDYAMKRLTESGYSPYYLYRQKNTLGNLENTGYSKAEKASLYNVYIMEELQTIIAVGAGASTKLVKNGKIQRVFNFKHPLEYNKNFAAMLERKQGIIDFFNNQQ